MVCHFALEMSSRWQSDPAALVRRVVGSLHNIAPEGTQVGGAVGLVNRSLHISPPASPQTSARGTVRRIKLNEPEIYSQFCDHLAFCPIYRLPSLSPRYPIELRFEDWGVAMSLPTNQGMCG